LTNTNLYDYSEVKEDYGTILSLTDFENNGYKLVIDSANKIKALYFIKDGIKNGQILKFEKEKLNQIATVVSIENRPVVHEEIYFNEDYSLNKKSFFSTFKLYNIKNVKLGLELDYKFRNESVVLPYMIVYNYNNNFSPSSHMDTSLIDNIDDNLVKIKIDTIIPGDTIFGSFIELSKPIDSKGLINHKLLKKEIFFKVIVPEMGYWNYEL